MNNNQIKIKEITNFKIIDKESNKVTLSIPEIKSCQLFEICNCKTAVCRVAEPDESCYWYRYFKRIILVEQNKRKI